MNILWWALLGIISGALAKFIMPGRNGGGCLVTMILGLIGAVVGGWIGTMLNIGEVDEFSIESILLATGGAILVLIVYGMITKKKS